MNRALKALLWRVIPDSVRRRVRPGAVPPPHHVDWGDLRSTKPVSRWFGYDRGLPIDRYYIEAFLAAHARDVRGCVLEIGDDSYTRRFGGKRVSIRDILHVSADAPGATIVGDLAHADHIPANRFDCIILTQTLHLIWDVPAAIRTLYRILAPGGVLLATVPGISPIDRGEWRDCWYWSFTPHSMTRLFAEHFPGPDVRIEHHGNVLSATAFVQGVAKEELRAAELDVVDEAFPVTIVVRAVKPGRP
jgi:SAM-dependent methyltransferase